MKSSSAKSGAFRPTEFEIRVAAELKTKGMRVTGTRLSVARVLDASKCALSVKDIHEAVVAMGHRVNLVSVYRILATLIELGLIHRIGSIDGYVACKLGEHHSSDTEHWVCSSCGDVHEMTLTQDTVAAARQSLMAQGFNPSSIKIEIAGECKRCQEHQS